VDRVLLQHPHNTGAVTAAGMANHVAWAVFFGMIARGNAPLPSGSAEEPGPPSASPCRSAARLLSAAAVAVAEVNAFFNLLLGLWLQNVNRSNRCASKGRDSGAVHNGGSRRIDVISSHTRTRPRRHGIPPPQRDRVEQETVGHCGRGAPVCACLCCPPGILSKSPGRRMCLALRRSRVTLRCAERLRRKRSKSMRSLRARMRSTSTNCETS